MTGDTGTSKTIDREPKLFLMSPIVKYKFSIIFNSCQSSQKSGMSGGIRIASDFLDL